MNSRLELHKILCNILNCPNKGDECRAYFQPPSSIKMIYPAIVYTLNNIDKKCANNGVYLSTKSYLLTIIDSNPDSELVDKISKLPMCKFSTKYEKDNLNHTVFEIY